MESSHITSPVLVYNAVGSGPEAAECTLWEWAWLGKNCAQEICKIKDRAELSNKSTLFRFNSIQSQLKCVITYIYWIIIDIFFITVWAKRLFLRPPRGERIRLNVLYPKTIIISIINTPSLL